MDQPKKKSRWRRVARRTAWLVAGLSTVVGVWFFFFPVPLGWAARLGIARAFPPEGPLRLNIDTVTFRWRWGQPAVALEIRGINATQQGLPLASVHEIVVEVPKSGLRHRHLAPSRITVSEPKLTLDQTRAVAPAKPPAASPTAKPGPPDLTPLALVLPTPGESSQLLVNGAVVQFRSAAGEVRIPLGRIELMLEQTAGGLLKLDAALPLTAGTPPPQLAAHATLEPHSGRTEFSLKVPAFSTADLPVLPGEPPLPLLATVALDAAGHYDLTTQRLDDVSGGISVTNGDVLLPGIIDAKLHIDEIEFRGGADLRAQHARLETGRIRIGSTAINIAELETTLGEQMKGRWQIEIAGLNGATLLPVLSPRVRTLLPLPPEAIGVISVIRIATRGATTISRDANGVWSSQIMQADGRLDFTFGAEPFACVWSARQPEGSDALTFTVALPTFVPARWPAVLLANTPAAAIDVPLTFTAQTVFTPRGEPRSARVALTGGAGTLKPLQPGLPALAVRQLEVRVETEQYDRAWRVPVARLELTNGAAAELVGVRVDRTPNQFAIQGEARAAGLSGVFAVVWLPPDTWAPLSAAGLAPGDLLLSRVSAHFQSNVVAKVGGGWGPQTLTATADAQVRVHAVPLHLTAQLSLLESTTQLEAALDLEEFRLSQLGLTLTSGLTTAAFDFPVSLHASAHAHLTGELVDAGLEVHAGSGRLRTPAAFGDLDVPVKSLALDAAYDPSRQLAAIKTLRLDAAGIRLNLSDVRSTIAPPQVVTGRLDLEPFALKPLLALWPASQQPELRRTVQATLRAGEFLGGQFDWNATLNSAAQPAFAISQLRGTARLAKIEATPAGVPGPVTLAEVKANVDYPRVALEVKELALPGVHLATANVQVKALNTPAPSASLTAHFETDFAVANQAWKFAPPDLLSGPAQGEISLEAPFTAATIDARVAIDFSHAKLMLPGFANAAPDTLNLTAHVTNALSTEIAPAADFSLSAGQWLGAPLHLAGHATLAADDHHPTLIELSTYEHGDTHLKARFAQPTATHRDISLTGASLDLTSLLRAGLSAADVLAAPAATKPVASPPAVAAPPPPMSINLDVQVDRVAFGPGESARKFELHTRLDNNWPASLTLETVSGPGNTLRAELTGPLDHQSFKLSIGDVAGWMRTLTSPWNAAPPAPGQFGTLVAQLRKVPSLVSGGGITAEMDIRRSAPEWLQGRFELSRATLVRPPVIFQLLAGKTGKALQAAPFIEKFSVDKISISQTQLSVGSVTLIGTGLVDKIKLSTATLGLPNEELFVDGTWFGTGFDFHGGTLSRPGLPWLKDANKLIRAVGQRNEFDFEDPPPAAPKPKKP